MSDRLPITKQKYSSGNDGAKHPNMKHDGYWSLPTPYVNERRLAVQREWFKNQR